MRVCSEMMLVELRSVPAVQPSAGRATWPNCWPARPPGVIVRCPQFGHHLRPQRLDLIRARDRSPWPPERKVEGYLPRRRCRSMRAGHQRATDTSTVGEAQQPRRK